MFGGGGWRVTRWQRRADDVMILSTWGWFWDGNAVWLATSSHVTRRLAADSGSSYITLAPGGGGGSRGGSECGVVEGWAEQLLQLECQRAAQCSVHACLSRHNRNACLILHIPANPGSFLNWWRSCQCDREWTVSVPLELTSELTRIWIVNRFFSNF